MKGPMWSLFFKVYMSLRRRIRFVFRFSGGPVDFAFFFIFFLVFRLPGRRFLFLFGFVFNLVNVVGRGNKVISTVFMLLLVFVVQGLNKYESITNI